MKVVLVIGGQTSVSLVVRKSQRSALTSALIGRHGMRSSLEREGLKKSCR